MEVLLLSWEEDDLNVLGEIEGMHNVCCKYGFNTERWLIPTYNSQLQLTLKAGEFLQKYGNEDCLVIVYYGGHAIINSARTSTWSWYDSFLHYYSLVINSGARW